MLLKMGLGKRKRFPVSKVHTSHSAAKCQPGVYKDKHFNTETTFKRLLILPIRSLIVNIVRDTFIVAQRTKTSPSCLCARRCKSDLLLFIAVFFFLAIILVPLIRLHHLVLPTDCPHHRTFYFGFAFQSSKHRKTDLIKYVL